MSSFCLRLLSASLLLVALYGKPGPARAGDLEDCAGAVLEKSEPACTAILNQSSRAADDRLKAYVRRARVYLATARLDQAHGYLNTAISSNPNLAVAFFLRRPGSRLKGEVNYAVSNSSRP